MHLGHIQLTTVLFFHTCLYFPFAGHIFVFAVESMFFMQLLCKAVVGVLLICFIITSRVLHM